MVEQNSYTNLLSERFTKFNISYPVIVKGWDILLNRKNEKFLKMKFQKISPDILAFKMDIVCLTADDEKIATYSNYTIKNINNKSINFFDTIPLDPSTEKVSVSLKQYVLTDATVGPAKCENIIVENEFKRFKRYENEEAAKRIIKIAQGLPIEKDSHWYCACGKLNWKHTEKCTSCNCDKKIVFKKITKENILTEKQTYNAMLEERAKKRRKGLITFASVTSAIAIFAITMLILCSTVIPMQSVTVDGISFSKNVDGSYYVKSCDLRSEDIIIPSTVRGRQVTKIGDMAFSDKKIKSITLPDSLTEIGNNAFYMCNGLEEITIPSSVTKIDDNAFENCRNLKKINLSDGLTTLGKKVFDSCLSLTEIELPSTLLTIGDYAFSRCSSLEQILIPENVTSVGAYVFYGCPDLAIFHKNNENKRWDKFWNGDNLPVFWNYIENGQTEEGLKWALTSDRSVAVYKYTGEQENLIIPEKINGHDVTRIYDKTFQRNDTLTSIELSDALTEIGEQAFARCSYLTSVNIPENLTSIGKEAFYNCSKLKEITIPKSVTFIGKSAFNYGSFFIQAEKKPDGWDINWNSNGRQVIWDCKEHGETSDGFKWKLTNDALINIYDYIGTNDTVTVPASINGYCVAVLDGAFSNCHNLTDVTFSPDCKITKLGNDTFSNCNNLKNIILPDSLTEIGSGAFSECNNLTNIAFPKNLKYIGDQVFSYCSNLPYIYLPDGLEKIGFRTFENCSRLKYIFIPASVSDIDFGLFSNTLHVNIFCQAQSKPDGWNDNWNDNRPNVTWGCSDYGITEDGFVWIEKDEDVRILDYIGSSSKLIIPAKINGKYFTSIADNAFYYRNDINSLEFDADSKIHTIGAEAFSNCNNLSAVTLPNSLVSIKNYAFNRCRFSQIIIPLSVTEIQGYAFSNNLNLKYIYCEASQKPDNWASNWYFGYVSVRWGYTAQ